ncbi:MAG: hypothetical protein M1816_002853, partial [Peltula sp. TS41687]
VNFSMDEADVQAMDEDQVIAASEESATVSQPSTPTHVAANIGKRRRKRVSLTRNTPSPGHSAKMAHIYQAARSSLTSPGSLTGPRTPSLQSLRISPAAEETPRPSSSMDGVETTSSENPFSPSDSTDGQTPTNPQYLPHLPLSVNATNEGFRVGIRGTPFIAYEPNSSGSTSPVPSDVTYPTLTTEDSVHSASQSREQTSEKYSAPSSGSDSTSGDASTSSGDADGEVPYLMFHGVPLPEPMTERQIFGSGKGKQAQRADAWIDYIFEDDAGQEDETESTGDRIKSERSSTTDWIKLERSSKTPSPEKGMSGQVHQVKVAEHQAGKASRPDLKQFGRGESDKENRKPTDPESSPEQQSPRRELRRVRLGPVRPIINNTPQSAPSRAQSRTLPNISATRFTPFKRPSKPATTSTQPTTIEARVEKPKAATPQPVSEDYMDVPLTPDVEIYRKGNRPKRTRCPSYFDEDIFQDLPDHPTSVEVSAEEEEDAEDDDDHGPQSRPVHGDGRKILGESAAQSYLTKPPPFCKEAENYHFKGA